MQLSRLCPGQTFSGTSWSPSLWLLLPCFYAVPPVSRRRNCAWHPGSCCAGLLAHWERPLSVFGARGEAGARRALRCPLRCFVQLAWPQSVAPSPQEQSSGIKVKRAHLRFPNVSRSCTFVWRWRLLQPQWVMHISLSCNHPAMLSVLFRYLLPNYLKLSLDLLSLWTWFFFSPLCLSVCLSVQSAPWSLNSLIQLETGSQFPCLVTACAGLKGGSQTWLGVNNTYTLAQSLTHTGVHNKSEF